MGIGVHQVDGSVGNDRVELGPIGPAIAEHRRVPAPADDPGVVGVLGGVRSDPREVVVDVVQVVEVHVAADPPGESSVDVRVLEPGNDASAAQDLRSLEPFLEIGLGADPDDPIASDRDRARPAAHGVDRVDVADDDQIRALGHGRGR